MRPNLERVPGNRDAFAEAILLRAPNPVDQRFLDSLDRKAWLWLGRYGARQPTIALREGSIDLLRQALLGTALSACLQPDDPRDVMVGLAVPWVVAQELGTAPAGVFTEIADRLTDARVASLFRDFGTRGDITLGAFWWEVVTTAEGPDFRPLRQ